MHAKRKLENGSIFADCENRLPIKPLFFTEMMFSRGVTPPPPPPPYSNGPAWCFRYNVS
jgi:hypothetical protein